MKYEVVIQEILNEIDRKIKEDVKTKELARYANYSLYHFSRVFMTITGTPVQNYITGRKLEYALFDLLQGEKIIDVAMKYGFETHAGFTKAFNKYFGCPPSLCRLHMSPKEPKPATIEAVKLRYGGINMHFEIKEINSFTVAGYPSRHQIPSVSGICNIPAFWDKITLDCVASLSTLHNSYMKSQHCEVSLCFDIDDEHDCFTYMVGVGVDDADKNSPHRLGVYLHQVQGGLYAVFTTPKVEEADYTISIQETWRQILEGWIPTSEYKYDDTRDAFEYYDERDHAWLHDGKSCMDIYIPVHGIK